MNNYFHTSKIQNLKKVFLILFFVVIFTVAGLLFGCSKNKNTTISQTFAIPTLIPSVTNEIIPTITPTPKITRPTSTPILVTPTKTFNPTYDLHITIDVTQEPPSFVPTTYPDDSEYLYKGAIVKVKLIDQFDAIEYLNLDDLTDNSMTNSDIEIERTIGNLPTYSLEPINNAYDYYSTESVMDYASCLKYFPLSGISYTDYSLQGPLLTYSGPYCVLTNEGRIAIVHYVTKKKIDNFVEELSLEVTVYRKKVE